MFCVVWVCFVLLSGIPIYLIYTFNFYLFIYLFYKSYREQRPVFTYHFFSFSYTTAIYIMCPCDIHIGDLPEHLLIDILIRVPNSEWVGLSSVRKQWAQLFRHDNFWQAALFRNFPYAANPIRIWPGPIIPHHFTKRRYAALYISKNLICINEEELDDEMLGHAYLFLKDQLQLPIMPPPAGILHGTLIDQFISCGKSQDKAHELASQIWVAVLDNLVENQQTFILLKRLALEGDVFLAYPYTKSIEVEWRVFEKLFTDFRDCFSREDYYDILTCAKHKFQPLPPIWLGF